MLSVVLVVVFCLLNVTPHAPCRHAMYCPGRDRRVSDRHLCFPNEYHHFGPQEQVEERYVRWKHWTLWQ